MLLESCYHAEIEKHFPKSMPRIFACQYSFTNTSLQQLASTRAKRCWHPPHRPHTSNRPGTTDLYSDYNSFQCLFKTFKSAAHKPSTHMFNAFHVLSGVLTCKRYDDLVVPLYIFPYFPQNLNTYVNYLFLFYLLLLLCVK